MIRSYEQYQEDMERRTRNLPTCCICDEKISSDAYRWDGEYMCEDCWNEFVDDNIRVRAEAFEEDEEW